MNNYDDPVDEYPIVRPPKTGTQKFTEQVDRVKPFVPYAILAWGIKIRSTNVLLTAVFSLMAVKGFSRPVMVSNNHFTSSPDGVGLVIK